MINARSFETLAQITALSILMTHGCDKIDEVSVSSDATDSVDAGPDDIREDTGRDSQSNDALNDGTTDSDAGDADSDTDDLSHCLLIDTTDWVNSGALSILDLDSGELRQNLTTYHSDAKIKVIDDEVYVINRLFGDSLMKLDPDDDYSVVWEFSVGNATNPSDLARFEDVGFVALYDTGKVIEVNLKDPTSETFLTGREIVVPTGTHDGGKAEAGDVFVHNGVLYVVSEGLNDSLRCTQGSRSRLYAYDAATLVPAEVFERGTSSSLTLGACNASVESHEDDEVVIRSLGNYQHLTSTVVNDGIVETVDISTGTRGDLLFTEQGAGNRDVFILESDAEQAWAVLAGDDFFGIDLVELDLTNARWAVKRELYTGYLWALAAYDGDLYVSERDIDSTGILVFDGATGKQLTERTIKTQAAPEELIRYDREGGCW